MTERHEREGVLRAVSLKAGTVEIVLGQDDGAKGADRVKGQGMSLNLTTSQNIDAIATRIKARGGVLDAEPDRHAVGCTRVSPARSGRVFLVISSERKR